MPKGGIFEARDGSGAWRKKREGLLEGSEERRAFILLAEKEVATADNATVAAAIRRGVKMKEGEKGGVESGLPSI